MRILDPGIYETKVDCFNCKAKLSYTWEDVIRKHDGYVDDYKYIICPLCKNMIIVKEELS